MHSGRCSSNVYFDGKRRVNELNTSLALMRFGSVYRLRMAAVPDWITSQDGMKCGHRRRFRPKVGTATVLQALKRCWGYVTELTPSTSIPINHLFSRKGKSQL